jgi:general stress protein 26
MARNYENLDDFRLDAAGEEALLRAQTECTFIWSSKDGWPLGVIMSFVFHEGHFWLTASSHRGRVAAVRENDHVSVVVSSTGTELGHGKSLMYRGTCAVHDDEATKRWFFPALGDRRFPNDPEYRREFVEKLDSSRRVVLEVTPGERIGFDAVKMHPNAKMYGGKG